MAHMVETMAYAGQVPWHGLGVPGGVVASARRRPPHQAWCVARQRSPPARTHHIARVCTARRRRLHAVRTAHRRVARG